MTRTTTLVAGMAIAVAGSSVPTFADSSDETSQRPAEVTAQLQDKLETADPAEKLRVTVKLDAGSYDTATATVSGTPNERASAKAHIASAQAKVAKELPQSVQIGYKFQNQHAFSALMTAEEIAATRAIDGVDNIQLQPEHKRMDAEAHALTDVATAHANGATGEGSTVAVIDDALDWSHEAFGGYSSVPNDKVLGGYDFADYDEDYTPDCYESSTATKGKGKPQAQKIAQSHGTAVSGVAVGNGGGVVGTAPDADLVFLKISDDSCGPYLRGDIAGALDWVVSNKDTYGIDVVNMSFGGGQYSSACDSASTYSDSLKAAKAAGVTLVAAAGNDAETSAISQPACHSDVISVGAAYDANIGGVQFSNCSDATTAADKVTCYSNSASFLDVYAPAHCAETAGLNGSNTNCFGGTSSASPYTAGIAALLKGKDDTLTPDHIRSHLINGGDPITDHRNGLEKTRVNAVGSLALVNAV